MGIFYRPDDGVAADFIPFCWQGQYHLFYLKDYRDPQGHGRGTPWWQIVTRDFVRFEDWGEALPRGPEGSQDLWVFTGSAIEHKGTFHIFYTAHNHEMAQQNRPTEGVAHATSPDLRTWTKDRDFAFFAPAGYEMHDWRDPFVYWDDDLGQFGMLLAARRADVVPSRDRGCTALATSPDLKNWTVREPFWAPDEYYTHECPDLFRMGEWWYLVYSTFSDRCMTHWRMSRSLRGPWLAPQNPDGGDSFDGRAFYAAKTAGEPAMRDFVPAGEPAMRDFVPAGEPAMRDFVPAGDGARRYVFGWLPTRDGENDTGGWQWGGNLVAHEVVQQPDGMLTVRAPETVLAAFDRTHKPKPRPALGAWALRGRSAEADAAGRVSALSLGPMPQECLIEVKARFERGTQDFGVLLRADEKLDKYYQFRVEPLRQRIVFDRWPRPGDQPFMLERPLVLKPGRPVTLRVIADGTCLVAYANDRVALSARMYEHKSGDACLFVTEGRVRFSGISIKTRG